MKEFNSMLPESDDPTITSMVDMCRHKLAEYAELVPFGYYIDTAGVLQKCSAIIMTGRCVSPIGWGYWAFQPLRYREDGASIVISGKKVLARSSHAMSDGIYIDDVASLKNSIMRHNQMIATAANPSVKRHVVLAYWEF